MDKLFLQGLASGNYRKWGPTQYRRWNNLIKYTTGTIGIENEVMFKDSDERYRKWHIIRSNTLYKENLNEFGKWFYDSIMGDNEVEIVALLQATKPYVLHKQLTDLIVYAEKIGINMRNSTHINVIADNKYFNIKYSDWCVLSSHIHAKRDYINTQNNTFSEGFRGEYIRIENKSGISSMFVEDYMFQFYVFLSFYNLQIRALNLTEKLKDSKFKMEYFNELVDINTQSVLLIKRLLLEEDYFLSVKKEYASFTYTKYVSKLLNSVFAKSIFDNSDYSHDECFGSFASNSFDYNKHSNRVKKLMVFRTIFDPEYSIEDIQSKTLENLSKL
jgi:hypothetical protein